MTLLTPRPPSPVSLPRRLELAPVWIEAHCVVPDGFRKGADFELYEYQLQYLGAFYLVRGDANWVPGAPVLPKPLYHGRLADAVAAVTTH